MHNAMPMNVLQSLYHLQHVHSGLPLGNTFSPLYQLLEGIVSTVLQHNVDVFTILKHIPKANNVTVLQRPVQLDLQHQLVALPLFVDLFLGDYLKCVSAVVCEANCFKAFGKATRT